MAYEQSGWSPFSKSRCWKGYEPTPGKKAYSKGSCRKKSPMTAYEVRAGQDPVEAKNQALAARGGRGSAGAKFALQQDEQITSG